MDSLPLYYRENFFSADTLFYTEEGGHRLGVAGDPIPYTVVGDNLLLLLLLGSFVVLVVSIAQSRRFIIRQLKDFFYPPRSEAAFSETSIELRFQFFLVGLWCLLLAIITYQYTTFYLTDTFIIDNELLLMAIFFGVFAAYQLLRGALYVLVNSVFFEKAQNSLWLKTLLFIQSLETTLVFPALLLNIYFGFSLKKTIYYFFFILLWTKMLTIYKGWSIFFRQNGVFLQTFLYFCTLEIVPLLSLTGGLLTLIDNLKFNF